MYADLARPNGGWSGIVKLVPERIKEIVALGRSGRSERVFLCDMSDLFHDDVPFEYIAATFGAMAYARNALFYVLTKRIERALKAAEYIEAGDKNNAAAFCINALWKQVKGAVPSYQSQIGLSLRTPWPLPNLAFGVTVEDARFGVPRLALGRRFPAGYHFASVEPLLADIGSDVDFSGYDLVIEGGEAGPGARPHDLAWARNVRDAARRVGARFFMKQAGDYVVNSARVDVRNIHKKVIRTADKGFANVTLKEEDEGCVIRPHRIRLGNKGNDLDQLPEDLRIRENLPMPGKP
jgi:protein gp37